MTRILLLLYQILIPAVPFAVAVLPFWLLSRSIWQLAAMSLFPIFYAVLYLLCCGLLSRPFRKGIQKGRFQRDLDDRVYGPRRLHSICWTSVYYSPFYSHYLTSPTLRRWLFGLFGYRGNLDFTLYPDTWIRDLPVLVLGKGAYLANKATIGTNLVLQDGRILVDGISIGEGAMVGHLAMVAAGFQLGNGAAVSHGTACNARSIVAQGSTVQPTCMLDLNARIGERTVVGAYSYVGVAATVGSDIVLPAGSNIPRRARISEQSQADDYLSSETECLQQLRDVLARELNQASGE